MYKNVSFCPD